MPELQLSRFAGQFPRSGPGQSSGAVPLPGTRTGAAPGAQSVNRLGQTLKRIGADLVAIDLQFANAKAQTLSVEASTTLAGEIQAKQFEIATNPAIYPSDRAAFFEISMRARVEALGESVPELGRARYVVASSRALQKATQALRVQGYEDSILRAKQAHATDQERLQRVLITAETDVERAEAIGALRANTQEMVTAGVFTPEEADASFRLFAQDTAAQQMEFLAQQNPTAALEQLALGPKGNPLLDLEAFRPLRDYATRLQGEELTEEARQERLKDDNEDANQDLVNLTLVNDAYRLVRANNFAGLAALSRQTMDLTVQGSIDSERHQGQTLSLINTFQRRLEAEQKELVVDNKLVLAELTTGLFDPGVATFPTRADITAAVNSGMILSTTAARLYKERDNLLDASYFRHNPEYKASFVRLRAAVTGILGPMEQLLNAFNSAQLQRWQEASSLYDSLMGRAQDRFATPDERTDIITKIAGPLADEFVRHYALQFQALQFKDLPRLRHGLEDIWKTEGLTRAFTILARLKSSISPEEHRALLKNLREREKLGATTGAEGQAILDAAEKSKVEELPNAFERFFNLFRGSAAPTLAP